MSHNAGRKSIQQKSEQLMKPYSGTSIEESDDPAFVCVACVVSNFTEKSGDSSIIVSLQEIYTQLASTA